MSDEFDDLCTTCDHCGKCKRAWSEFLTGRHTCHGLICLECAEELGYIYRLPPMIGEGI